MTGTVYSRVQNRVSFGRLMKGTLWFLLLLAFPPLEVAALMQLSDQVFASSFFLPTGLWTSSEGIISVSGGGHPWIPTT